jgi:hypothetical protein
MGLRHPNPRLAKIHRNYSVEDVSRLFGIHKNTVRNWLNQGLEAIDHQRPILVLGAELVRFLTKRRNDAKQKCGPGRIYCLPCRAPKIPAGNIADCIQTNLGAGSLCGICPDCNRLIYRRVNLARLSTVCGDLEVTLTRQYARLVESVSPIVICDLPNKADTHEEPQPAE